MNYFLILTVSCLAVSDSIFDEDITRINGENGWYVPRVDGYYDWVNINQAESYIESMQNTEAFGLLSNSVTFYLYTKLNPEKSEQISASNKSISVSNFNPAHPTRFIIHGWRASFESDINKILRDAWLSLGEYNIIAVDWAQARARYRTNNYPVAVLAVPKAGKKVAVMIDYLVNNYGMSLDSLFVIGHSLGAHVAGYAGKNIKNGQINTIIGLDPALPLFNFNKANKRLSSTDAFYVESIHTNGGLLGFLKPIGKGAFYPNGGKWQPGCCLNSNFSCSHERSITYYAEAVTRNNFRSKKCRNYKDAVAKNCTSTYSSVLMGAIENAFMVSGEYFVPVNEMPPYGVLV